MLLIKDSDTFKKAAAWHDHGHENNPNLPRWEDSRSGTGFNYRMMELQGAVGIAQLNKLENIVASQRKNLENIWEEISDIPFIVRREPSGSFSTADALIFLVKDKSLALKIRK